MESNWLEALTTLKIGPDNVSLVDVSSSNSENPYLEMDNTSYLQESELDS